MRELHLTKKDFSLEWFSGTGAGGQHRNKHQNCCRITHKATGLRAQGTESRCRVTNQRTAFTRLAHMVIAHYADEPKGRRDTQEVIRTYHSRNGVVDSASGRRFSYREIVEKGDAAPAIEARRKCVR